MRTTVDSPLFVRFISPGPVNATWTEWPVEVDPDFDWELYHDLVNVLDLVSA